MAWYEKDRRRSDATRPIQFVDVGAKERRIPSWIAREPLVDSKVEPENPQRGRPLREPPIAVPSNTPQPMQGDGKSEVASADGERGPQRSDRPPSIRAPSYRPSRPSNARISMSPSQLEAIISERAAQRARTELLEGGKSLLTDAIESLDQAKRDLLYGAEPRLIELAILVARRVIGRELKTQPELVADLVREGIDALSSREKVRIHLGTGFAMMAVMVSEQLAARGIVAEITVDAKLPEHGCIVETDIGRVDESIAVRIDALLEAIDTEEEV